MIVSSPIAIDYAKHYDFIRKEVAKLLKMGFPQTDVYRGVGITFGKLGKIYTTAGLNKVYVDKEGYMYFLVESYMNPTSHYMVKIKDDSDFVCECPSFIESIKEQACKHGKDGGACTTRKIKTFNHCKHIVASIIIKDFIAEKRNIW